MIGLGPLADDVCALRHDEAVTEALEQRIYDTLAAVGVGSVVEDVPPLDPGADEASLLRFATAAARATETDDIYVPGCATLGAVVVPAAVLSSGNREALLDGVLAGYEAGARLALAIDGASLVYEGVWTTLVCAPVAAAAAAGRAMGLTPAEMRSALALAASRSVPRAPAPGGGLSPRWWAIGAAAADGRLAACAARAGVTASEAVDLPAAARQERLDSPLPRPAVLDVDTKAFPSARQTLAAVEAAIEACDGVPIDEIERIAIGLPAQVLSMVDGDGSPRDRLESVVDVRYQVALALTELGELLDAVRSPVLDPAPLVSAIDVSADGALTDAFPSLGGRATIRLRDGAERSAIVLAPPGSAGRPFRMPELEAKWHDVYGASGVSLDRLGAVEAALADGGQTLSLAAFLSRTSRAHLVDGA